MVRMQPLWYKFNPHSSIEKQGNDRHKIMDSEKRNGTSLSRNQKGQKEWERASSFGFQEWQHMIHVESAQAPSAQNGSLTHDACMMRSIPFVKKTATEDSLCRRASACCFAHLSEQKFGPLSTASLLIRWLRARMENYDTNTMCKRLGQLVPVQAATPCTVLGARGQGHARESNNTN